MEYTSPPTTVSRKTRKASAASKAYYNYGKPMIRESTKEYFLDHIPPYKRKTRRGRTSDNTDNFSMRISKRNIPRSSRVLRSATQILHDGEILSENQSCPHPSLGDLQDTDPLHFEIGGDISSSEESPTEHSKASNRLLIKRVGSEHRSAGPPKGCYIKRDADFNELSMENNNSTTQPNNNVTADGHELMVEPHQRALIADEQIYCTDNLTSVPKVINSETRSQNDAALYTDFDHLLSDGSTFFEDYRWLLGFDTNDLAPELPEVSIDDIATLPNLNLDESVPVTEIRPTLFQSDTCEIDSNLIVGLTSYQWDGCSQISDSVATRFASQPIIPQHEPLCVSTSVISSPLYFNTNFQTLSQAQCFETTIQNSGELAYPATSGGNIERISSPDKTSRSSILNNNPNSPYIKQEFDFEPQCRIYLVDTPPSFTRTPEPDATPIRHQVFEGQNSAHSDERPMRNLSDWQQQSVARQQWTGAAEPNELQNWVHSVGPQISTCQDRQRESFARPQGKSGTQLNERQNSVHSNGPAMNTRQDVINSQHYQADIFQGQPFMRTPLMVGAATYRPQPSEFQNLVHSEEPLTVSFQSRQQQPFTRPQTTSGAQLNERQDAINSVSYQAEAFRREQPFVLAPLPTKTTYRAYKQQRSVHPDEPPMRIFRSRQQVSVTRPQGTSGVQANELQNSVHSREPPSPHGVKSTGAQASELQASVQAKIPPIRTYGSRKQESRSQRTSRAQPNERQNSNRQKQVLARPQRTSRPMANDTFRSDQPCMRTPLPCTTTYNPQTSERQNLFYSGSTVGRIYPRPFARIPSTVVTATTPRAIERQNWHHSYQPQRETHYSWQDNPSSATMDPLRDAIEAGQNLTSSKQYHQNLKTVRKRSQQTRAQMEASGRDISIQQYESAALDAESNQYLRTHSVSRENRVRNIPSSSGARNELSNPEPMRETSGQQANFSSYARSEVSSVMGMHTEHSQNSFPPMLPSHSLPANYANTPQGSVDHSSPDERAQFGSWRDSLNVLSNYGY